MKVMHQLPAIFGLASCAAFAQTGALAPQTSPGSGVGGTPPGLERYAVNGVGYMCGGVGSEQSQYLKAVAPEHDLAVTFATNTGAYLADVTVEIADVSGNLLLDAVCDGPIMLVDFPRPGTYRIRAESDGRMLTRAVTVSPGKGARTVFTWPADASEQATSDVIQGLR